MILSKELRERASANELAELCIVCGSSSVERIFRTDIGEYRCAACSAVMPRLLILDPELVFWFDGQGTYWHESAGVLVENEAGEILFFERTMYPLALTIPAGHVNRDEDHAETARRETREETGLEIDGLHLVAEDDVHGDACRRGSDDHRWHLYRARIRPGAPLVLSEEGRSAVWLTREAALEKKLIVPVRYFLEKL